MTELEATTTFILFFVLRCALPLGLILGVGYLMNWWVERAETSSGKKQPVNPEFCQPFIKFGKQCWSVQMRNEGELPERCITCPIYKYAVATVN